MKNPISTFDTLYIGGGTPSILTYKQIAAIIEQAHHTFGITADAEITIEVNPGAIDKKQLNEYESAGINRINIGVQSFALTNLQFLGRIHSGKAATHAIRTARDAGFSNVGLDFIYGIPGQDTSSWLQDLSTAMKFTPEHLSCYMITYETGTPMTYKMKIGDFKRLSDRKIADLFISAQSFLSDSGYEQYEISNFARYCRPSFPGSEEYSFRSKHNQKYWSFAPYVGLGPSAHTFVEPFRYWNVRDVEKYIDAITHGRQPIENKECLTPEQKMIEVTYLGLRTSDGIDIPFFERAFNINFQKTYEKALQLLSDQGLIEYTDTRCALTSKGMLLLDSIAERLILEIKSNKQTQ